MRHELNGRLRQAYALAALVVVLGCLAATIIFGTGASGLPDGFKDAFNLDSLTQVVVPGSAELVLSRTGVYAVYYEYRSVVDGVEYAGSVTPPALTCSITSSTTGQEIQAAPDYVETNRYATYRDRRVGVLAMSFSVNEPDTYLFSCRYPDGRTEPPVVLAVGQNIFWELIAVVARTAGSGFSGLAVMCGSAILALVIVGAAAFARRRRLGAIGSQAPLQST